MDKKNLTIGVILMLAAFASLYIGQKFSPPSPVPPGQTLPTQPSTPTGPNDGTTPAITTTTPGAPLVNPQSASFAAAVVKDDLGAQVVSLANSFVEIRLSNRGGAIREVAFRSRDLKGRLVYPSERLGSEPFIFNELHSDPMLGFVEFPGLDRHTVFEMVSKTAYEVVYRAVFEDRIEVTRRYYLPDGSEPGTDPYQLRHETKFRNLTDQTTPLPRVALSLGTTAPISAVDYGMQLATGYSTGKDQEFIERSELQGGGFLSWFGFGSSQPLSFIASPGPLVWASVSNQFFTAIATPDAPAAGLVTRRVELPAFADKANEPNFGVTGIVQFDVPALTPRGESVLGLHFYVGPKEYTRLANSDVFKADQDKVMNFAPYFFNKIFFSGFFAPMLLIIMTAVHGWIVALSPTWAWGWAIIITTLILKIVFLWPTLAASKSAKRMAKLQPEMQAIREKLKDNPQKMQAATIELFKKHRVNPVGGCLPILITMPFFIAFFTMLQSTAELRFAPFLWSADLSAPDTVSRIFGFPINILPLLMGATMIIQMRLTPMPSTDNMQAKIFKFMPWIFTLICYNFSGALALYSTINGAFTIGQQLVVNRMKDDPLPAPVAAPVNTKPGKPGKPVKNVTPKKK
jgi:YidC/Oxa1 family membrane protein insertase